MAVLFGIVIGIAYGGAILLQMLFGFTSPTVFAVVWVVMLPVAVLLISRVAIALWRDED